MPELPEVETVVRGLRAPLIGRTVQSMWSDVGRTVQMPEEFAARIIGQTFRAIHRRAKYIVAELDHDLLVIHLKMTGRLYVVGADETWDDDRWLRFKLGLDNGKELRFSDSRRFGRVYLTPELGTVSKGAASLGPEPLEDDFTLDVFKGRLEGRGKNIKALLLDQSFIAGVGNIYADEALFRAGIHPLRKSDSLTTDEVTRLYETVRAALSDGVNYEGASVNWYRKADGSKGESQDHFYVYGRDGELCRNCGQVIIKLRVAQRGTHVCPNCQPEGG